MTTLTVRDFLEQLAGASPDARLVFKIECEDKNFDARLEFSRVTCLSPATEVVVTMADNTEDVRGTIMDVEQSNGRLERRLERAEARFKEVRKRITESVQSIVDDELSNL